MKKTINNIRKLFGLKERHGWNGNNGWKGLMEWNISSVNDRLAKIEEEKKQQQKEIERINNVIFHLG